MNNSRNTASDHLFSKTLISLYILNNYKLNIKLRYTIQKIFTLIIFYSRLPFFIIILVNVSNVYLFSNSWFKL